MIISFVSQKGGSGKTTSCVNIAAAWQRLHPRVKIAFIDLDGQQSLADMLSPNDGPDFTIFDVAAQRATVQQASIKTPLGALIIGDTKRLATATAADITPLIGAFAAVSERFDVVLIDNAPALTAPVIASLLAADVAVIPERPDVFGLRALQQAEQIITTVTKQNPRLKIAVLPMATTRTRSSAAGAEALSKQAAIFGYSILPSIRESIACQSAAWTAPGTVDHKSPVGKDFEETTKALIKYTTTKRRV